MGEGQEGRGEGRNVQSAPWEMVVEQAAPREAKSAERMEGAIIGGGGREEEGGILFVN